MAYCVNQSISFSPSIVIRSAGFTSNIRSNIPVFDRSFSRGESISKEIARAQNIRIAAPPILFHGSIRTNSPATKAANSGAATVGSSQGVSSPCEQVFVIIRKISKLGERATYYQQGEWIIKYQPTTCLPVLLRTAQRLRAMIKEAKSVHTLIIQSCTHYLRSSCWLIVVSDRKSEI